MDFPENSYLALSVHGLQNILSFIAVGPKLRALYLESIVPFRLYSVFTGRTTRVSERDSKCSPPEYKYESLALHQIAALDSADLDSHILHF
jgi:hypothetical protein